MPVIQSCLKILARFLLMFDDQKYQQLRFKKVMSSALHVFFGHWTDKNEDIALNSICLLLVYSHITYAICLYIPFCISPQFGFNKLYFLEVRILASVLNFKKNNKTRCPFKWTFNYTHTLSFAVTWKLYIVRVFSYLTCLRKMMWHDVTEWHFLNALADFYEIFMKDVKLIPENADTENTGTFGVDICRRLWAIEKQREGYHLEFDPLLKGFNVEWSIFLGSDSWK